MMMYLTTKYLKISYRRKGYGISLSINQSGKTAKALIRGTRVGYLITNIITNLLEYLPIFRF